ncbi:MAG: PA2169 family four-helix-bundle protein [Bacteroidota bacterium]
MNTTVTEELIEVLNDLIKINNDRIEGYEKARDEIRDRDVDLQGIFGKMADDSRRYVGELTQHIQSHGGETAKGTTGLGKIYRAWMDVKTTFTGKDRTGVLELCEYGEDAAQKAYNDALSSDAEMDAETRQLITSQKTFLKESHDMIKRYRDISRSTSS